MNNGSIAISGQCRGNVGAISGLVSSAKVIPVIIIIPAIVIISAIVINDVSKTAPQTQALIAGGLNILEVNPSNESGTSNHKEIRGNNICPA